MRFVEMNYIHTFGTPIYLMKIMRYLKYLLIISFLSGISLMIGCKNDEPGETEEEIQIKKLTATWEASSVTLDGADRTADWATFRLTATGTLTYSTANTGDDNVWPASGTWSFAGTTGSGLNVLNRSDGVTVNITSLTDTNLDLSITFALAAPNKEGRVASIEGDWVFKMTKQ